MAERPENQKIDPSPPETASRCYLVSDLHGNTEKYESLFSLLRREPPDALFMAGDLLPASVGMPRSLELQGSNFVDDFLIPGFDRLRRKLGDRYPAMFLILGNDDARFEEASLMTAATRHVWHYAHERRITFGTYTVYGYSCIPPSPFQNKDWERYDVSRYVDPGCVSPEEGFVTVPMSLRDRRYRTISRELQWLTGEADLSQSILLSHVPPYNTKLDRAALDNTYVEGVPMDTHIGSIAVRRLIEQRQPLVTLHGHVHESFRLTGAFKDRIAGTWCLSGADDTDDLVVVDFDLRDPGAAVRRKT